jgi:phage tail sheath gpL-like
MAITNIQIVHSRAADLTVSDTPSRVEMLNRLINFLAGIAGGAYAGTSLRYSTAAVKASGTVTCAAVQADDTVTINGQTFTAKASGATGDQWNITALDNTATAAALAAAINASTTAGVTGIVTATSALGVVTISAIQSGKVGNAISLASSDGTRLAVSAAKLASGADTSVTLSL